MNNLCCKLFKCSKKCCQGGHDKKVPFVKRKLHRRLQPVLFILCWQTINKHKSSVPVSTLSKIRGGVEGKPMVKEGLRWEQQKQETEVPIINKAKTKVNIFYSSCAISVKRTTNTAAAPLES